MKFIAGIHERARRSPQRIAFIESDDQRIIAAAAKASESGIAKPVLIGVEADLRQQCERWGYDCNLFEFSDMNNEAYTEELLERFVPTPESMLSRKGVMKRLAIPLYRGLIMEAVGDVAGTYAGFNSSTGEVVLAAQIILGLKDGVRTPSSFNLLEDVRDPTIVRLVGCGDCTVCVSPTSEELADIAIACCDTFKVLVGHDPLCAMLSYSTCGSASGEEVDKVAQAVRIADEKRPDLRIDGEFQLDAALNPEIASKKVERESSVAGYADLIIWPNLCSGNIGIKLVQQFGCVKTYGAFLQGFKKPVFELSRGDTAQTIYDGIAFASVLASAAGGSEV